MRRTTAATADQWPDAATNLEDGVGEENDHPRLCCLRRQAQETRPQLAASHNTAARTTATGALAAIDRLPERRFAADAEAQVTAVLGLALLREDRAAEALPVLRKALGLHLSQYDPVHSPATATVRAALAEAQRSVGS